MQAKHPVSTPFSPPMSSVPLPCISEEAVVRVLRSFPNGSAPGPSSLRAYHLRETVQCPSRDRSAFVTRGLTKLNKLLIAGKAPPEVQVHLCGASLIPIKKKNGGLRPIAVGEALPPSVFPGLLAVWPSPT